MMDFSPQPNQGRAFRAAGTREGGRGQVPFADKSRPAYLNPAEACRVQSEASFALSFGLQARSTATGMQPECPGPAPWDSHDAVGQPTGLGCGRA
jgi:hypothetical protein